MSEHNHEHDSCEEETCCCHEEHHHEDACCCGEHEHHHHHEDDCCHDHDHHHHHHDDDCDDDDCCCHDHDRHHHHHDDDCDDDDCCCHDHHHHHDDECEDECCCGHDHHHEHGHHCTCGACAEEERKMNKRDIILLIAAIVMTAGSFLIPNEIVKTVVLAAATLMIGWKMILDGLKGLFRFSLDEMTLMSIAVITAFIIGEGFEGAMVTILFHIGEYIENHAVQTGRKRLDALMAIVPETANVLFSDGKTETVAARKVKVGETILIRAGERIPLDCEVLSGTGEIDTSTVTGESQPIPAEPGSNLLSGMINLNGALTCRTTQTAKNSTASKIADMVKQATRQQGKTERFITRFSKVYTPIVVVLAILVAALPPLFGAGAFTLWLHRALIFLVASCPCALVISIPMTFYNVISASSHAGALIKGSQHIETLAGINQFVFDKTGTLTTGELSVRDIFPAENSSSDNVLRLAAICESASTHPIAQAVRSAAGTVPAPDSAEDVPGKGVRAVIGGKTYLCGSAKWMKENNFSIEQFPESQLYLASESGVLGCIRTGDTLRSEAKGALKSLKDLGVKKTVMLTGDRKQAAQQLQADLALDDIRAELLPQDKVSALHAIRKDGITAFVGDGINDGPVLAAADIGFAMGMGSDLAAQAADIVLLNNNLNTAAQTISIARRGLNIARQNVAFILGIKAIVLVLGAIGYAPMWSAVFADVGVSVLAILNAMRAGQVKN